jgi:hypothetical protein
MIEGHGERLPEVLRLATQFGDELRGNLLELAVLHGSSISLGRHLFLRPASGEERAVEGEIPAACRVDEGTAQAFLAHRLPQPSGLIWPSTSFQAFWYASIVSSLVFLSITN